MDIAEGIILVLYVYGYLLTMEVAIMQKDGSRQQFRWYTHIVLLIIWWLPVTAEVFRSLIMRRKS